MAERNPVPPLGELPETPRTTALDADVLLEFFDRYGRDLPWRRPDAGPWGVLVSEFMLQQTPVVRVLPVYQEWLARWPTPGSLAIDSPGAAVRAWGRLGYPRRALRLHAAATGITNDHGGEVPDTVEALLQLPGVGEYTARAVAAFAYGRRTPVVDTNVRRVLSRTVRGQDSVREPATAADRRELADLLPADPARAAKFSAAVMELGALVCTAARPNCPACPLRQNCAWRAAGHPATAPRRAAQTWQNTDRQARGRIMAVLRGAPGAVDRPQIDLAWPDSGQCERCVLSLLADGLIVRDLAGRLGLPS